jgi:hypothetical protein
MSQIGGVLNSCPATNRTVFGVSQPLALDVKKILDLIDLPNKLSYDEVILAARMNIMTNPIDGQVSEGFVFKEVLDGLKTSTPLEEEIMRKSFIIREDTGRLRVGTSGSIPSGAPTDSDMKKYLSSFEYTRYKQASVIGARDILIDLNRKVVFLMSQEVTENDESPDKEGN